MNMNFSTASTASPSTMASQPEAVPSPLSAISLPGDNTAGPAAATLSAPLFAMALNSAMSAAVTQDQISPGAEADAPAASKAADSDAGTPADIAQAATQPEAALPAMAIPMMAPPALILPQVAAALESASGSATGTTTGSVTGSATASDASVATRQDNGQANLAVNSSLHADAVAFNVQTASLAPRRAAGEPIAAATQGAQPSSAFQATLAASAAPAATTAPVAAAAPTLARDGERSAAPAPAAVTPVAGQVSGMASAVAAAPGNDTIKLNGPAQQWQEPLREAMGERLQTQIGRNSEHATIRLEPPMLGRIDISIRHAAGALQVNVTASNPEVLRQLQGIGESMRSDLAQRQYTDVAVNISATPRSAAAQAFTEGDARGQRQPGRQNDDAEPGRALSDSNTAAATYAMPEREMT